MSGVTTMANTGGALLMVLVIVAMLVVMFSASVGVISQELHTSADAEQRERVYRVAESGISHVLFLVGKAGKDITYLSDNDNTPTEVKDPVTEQVIGTYTLAVSSLPSPAIGVSVSSTASSPDERFCSKVSARIEGSSEGQYRISGWTRSNC